MRQALIMENRTSRLLIPDYNIPDIYSSLRIRGAIASAVTSTVLLWREKLPVCGRVLLVCLIISTASGCSLKGKTGGNVAGASISQTALSTVGTPYRMGGTTPSRGFDCSGLVLWAYAKHGLNVPRTAREQSSVGSAVSKGSLQKGDIVVFKISSGVHTGIYTGSGKFVHSPSRGKTVREDKIDSKYWSRRFVSGRRV